MNNAENILCHFGQDRVVRVTKSAMPRIKRHCMHISINFSTRN
jgi:hypothetical protein